MIYLDSNIFIYFFNENPEFYKSSTKVINSVRRGVLGVTSVVTLSEVMSREYEEDMKKAMLLVENLIYKEVDEDTACLAGKLRSDHPTLKLPDAIHVATAMNAGVTKFVTNDKKLLALKKLKQIKFVSILDYSHSGSSE